MRLPRIHGSLLHQLARLARTRPGSATLQLAMRADFQLDAIADVAEALRGDIPTSTRPLQASRPRKWEDQRLAPPTSRAWSGSTATYADRYEHRRTTPEVIVRRVIEAARELARRTPSMTPLCEIADSAALEEAEAAGDRYRAGAPKGPLDGMCFTVKEQTAVAGLPLRQGTTFRDKAPKTQDATVVKRLRAAGAIVVGQTPMTEYGMSPLGYNPNRAMPRNPHDVGRLAGGSSTGAGVSVATGLVPFALGADGGGSIRIPAALNGVFGIKPTWGRISRAGDESTGSVAHIGPLAASTWDLAQVLEHIGAPDASDPETEHAPALPRGSLVDALGRGVRGARIGIDEREWAEASEPVAKAGRDALRALEKEGAKLVPVQMDLGRLALPVGALIIAIESRCGNDADWRAHASDMTDDVQFIFSILDHMTAVELMNAMRVRSGIRKDVARVLREVDVLALPTTATTAPAVTDEQFASGFLDSACIREMCRFTFLANLTGLPALSMPVGLDPNALPIGLQIIGDAWDEASVLAIAAHAERTQIAEVVRPNVHVRILD
jgi:aspartyl-tRNA(Asn)/glutamyl-tRNA(Gln) amidotransferase subunit A